MTIPNSKNPYFGGLKRQYQQAAILLASGFTPNEVANQLGFSRVYLWHLRRENENFINAIEFEKNLLVNHFRTEIYEVKKQSLNLINTFLDNTEIPICKRLKIAANVVFNRQRIRKKHQLH